LRFIEGDRQVKVGRLRIPIDEKEQAAGIGHELLEIKARGGCQSGTVRSAQITGKPASGLNPPLRRMRPGCYLTQMKNLRF